MKKIYFLILILIKLVFFFHLVLDTTPKVTPSNAKGISEENQEGQVSPTLSKEVGGGLAKECGDSKNTQVVDYTTEQVQAAKDFIWENLDSYGRESMILFSTTDSLKLNELELDKLLIYVSVKNLPQSPGDNK